MEQQQKDLLGQQLQDGLSLQNVFVELESQKNQIGRVEGLLTNVLAQWSDSTLCHLENLVGRVQIVEKMVGEIQNTPPQPVPSLLDCPKLLQRCNNFQSQVETCHTDILKIQGDLVKQDRMDTLGKEKIARLEAQIGALQA